MARSTVAAWPTVSLPNASVTPARVVVIGTGALTGDCVDIVRRSGALPVEAIEVEIHGISFLEALCRRTGVPYRRTVEGRELSSYFAAITEPTLVVSAFNRYLFPAAVLANSALNVVNFHNALLPRNRGRNACTWAIYEGDEVTGATWHEVTPEIDAGAIISETVVRIDPTVSALGLTQICFKEGAASFGEVLPGLLRADYPTRPQRSDIAPTMHHSTDIPNGGVFDLTWPVAKQSAFLRSLDYGRHKVFSDPVVTWQGQRHAISSYSLATNHAHSGDRQVAVAGRTMTICEGTTRLELALES
jgi:folate-dependent phosphoribosylglycinamide formyltransferase PurN